MLYKLYNIDNKKGGEKMAKERFGGYLKKLRLEKRIGLREFARLIGILPSNLCHIESGKHSVPQNPEFLKKVVKTLGLKESDSETEKLYNLATKHGEIPADVREYMCEQDIMGALPVMARTIKNKKLTRKDIEKLIEDIKKL